MVKTKRERKTIKNINIHNGEKKLDNTSMYIHNKEYFQLKYREQIVEEHNRLTECTNSSVYINIRKYELN